MKNKKTPTEFVSNAKYLPKPLRDFHDQKRLFKSIWHFVQNKHKQDTDAERMPRLEGMDWVQSHLYVIDFFLWFMAMHGYTLQRSRQPVDFFDLDTALKEGERRWIERIEEANPEFFPKATAATAPPPITANT
jgi:hypothetical protein